MRLYIQVFFWLGVFAFVLRIIAMAGLDWPQVRGPKSLGLHVADTIIGLGMTLWAGILLYASQQ